MNATNAKKLNNTRMIVKVAKGTITRISNVIHPIIKMGINEDSLATTAANRITTQRTVGP